jgi:hypothetical protein
MKPAARPNAASGYPLAIPELNAAGIYNDYGGGGNDSEDLTGADTNI